MAEHIEPPALGSQELPQRPLVFMFQPTEYVVVAPERFSEWEADMRERVGLAATIPEEEMRPFTPSYFYCGGDFFDGCDTI